MESAGRDPGSMSADDFLADCERQIDHLQRDRGVNRVIGSTGHIVVRAPGPREAWQARAEHRGIELTLPAGEPYDTVA
jgi:hypothetical protein